MLFKGKEENNYFKIWIEIATDFYLIKDKF